MTRVLALAVVLGAAGFAWASGEPGTLDEGFLTLLENPAGPVVANEVADLEALPDGKYLLAGRTYWGSSRYDWRLARFASTGGLDETFGGDGVVQLFGGTSDLLASVAVAVDGTVYAAGRATAFTDRRGNPVPGTVLVRLLPNGSIDTSFGGAAGGLVVLPMMPNQMVVDASGRILIAGTHYVTGKKGVSTPYLRLCRFLASGAKDTTFGTNGVFDDLRASAKATVVWQRRLVIQADGRFVLCHDTSATQWAFTRYLTNGGVDTTYGSAGTVTGPAGQFVTALALDADGRLLVQGHRAAPDGEVVLVVRYGSGGAVDATFGSSGTVVLQPYPTTFATPGISVQADGRLVLPLAFRPVTGSSETHTLAARLDANGALDTSFGTGGYGEPISLGLIDYGYLVLSASGEIVVAGKSIVPNPTGVPYLNDFRWFAARYFP